MKVKIIQNCDSKILEEEINLFIEGKVMVDIKFSEWASSDNPGNSVLILYHEKTERR